MYKREYSYYKCIIIGFMHLSFDIIKYMCIHKASVINNMETTNVVAVHIGSIILLLMHK